MSFVYNILTHSMYVNGVEILGYREFAKDYQIEYVDRPGHKRPKAVRVYIGPWYRFAEPERIPFLRWFYLIGLVIIASALLIPMCINCTFTRIWYIQVPIAAAWIPWLFAALATWQLWTAKDKVNREHNAMIGDRMSGASFFLMGLCLVSFMGCIYTLSEYTAAGLDYLVCGCCTLSGVCGIALFSQRKRLNTVLIEQ